MRRCPDCRAILSAKSSGPCPFCGGGEDAEAFSLEAVAHPDQVLAVAAKPVPRRRQEGRHPAAAASGAPARPAAPEPREERVSRHDEAVGFERSPMVQAVIVILMVLFAGAALVWFWN